jgi:Ribonuclease G/E
VRQAGAAVVPAVTQATVQAVEASMQLAFVDIGEPARKALEAAVKPVHEQFLGLAQRILQLEVMARRAMTWFSVKWIALTAAGFVGMSAMAWGSVWWQRNIVRDLTEQKTALETDIAEMQLNAAALAKKGARIKIVDCGGRLCIVASKNQTGSFSEWHGLWNDNKTGQTMVIPNGY